MRNIEHAHHRQGRGGGHYREPLVDRMGNEMRADQAVRRCPADREGAPEPPEIAVAEGRPKGHEQGFRGGCSGGALGYRIGPRAMR